MKSLNNQRLFAVIRGLAAACTLIAVSLQSSPVMSGGGPEGVLLVVNPQSTASLSIANLYVKLRHIPPENVVYFPWKPQQQTTDIDMYRDRILSPIIQVINNRRLADQIDYVVFSSDFPTAISLDPDVRKFLDAMRQSGHSIADDAGGKTRTLEWPKQITPVASLNGLTFLWQAATVGKPAYLEMRSNYYSSPASPNPAEVASVGFRGNRLYGPKGETVESGGRRYFLSTVLGVTAGRGNSPTEVLDYLKRSAAADGTRPKGTIYFMKSEDVRSKVRQNFFEAAVERLTKLGVDATMLDGTIPLGKKDVQGVIMGTPKFDWKSSESKILPGAICDNFTSFGGVLTPNAEQTPLSEFMRYGAAGSSGAVTEPYAIAHKFAAAFVQSHYASGCTLAEAYYQSIPCPYQLLIVGDPLCRPWAIIPDVFIAGVKSGDVVSGPINLQPSAIVASGPPAKYFDLFIDGRRISSARPGVPFTFDTAKLADGHHELRIVAVGPPPIESQGRKIVRFRSKNHDRKIEASLATGKAPAIGSIVKLKVNSPGSIGVVAMHGNRVVGRLAGSEGILEFPAELLGLGSISLRVIGLGWGGEETNAVSDPVEFVME